MSAMSFSIDGSLMAYGVAESGSDWSTIKVRNTETGEDYRDNLERTKFSTIAWTHDNKGFFYSVSKKIPFEFSISMSETLFVQFYSFAALFGSEK